MSGNQRTYIASLSSAFDPVTGIDTEDLTPRTCFAFLGATRAEALTAKTRHKRRPVQPKFVARPASDIDVRGTVDVAVTTSS